MKTLASRWCGGAGPKRPLERIFRHLATGAVLVAAIGLAVPGTAGAGEFRWSFQSDAVSLDPYVINETFTLGFMGNIYESLIRRGKNLEIEPALAESWSNLAADVWRFKLRQGVKFHDGTPFTADDVVFSFKRLKADGSDLVAFGVGMKEVKKVDDFTIDIVTNGPRPTLLNDFPFWYIMSKAWAEKHNVVNPPKLSDQEEAYSTLNANGTGPFKVVKREPDVVTVLEPYDGWWDEKEHNITRAEFRPIKSAPTRVAAFLSGELDMMYPAPLQDVNRIKAAPGLRVLMGPEARTIFLGMDQVSPELKYSSVKGKNPFKDLRVRQAFYQAIDIKAIKIKIMRNASIPTALMIAPQITGFDAALNKRLPYDPAASKRLLAEAGYASGFDIVMDCPNDRYVNDEAICQAVVVMLNAVGVKATLNAESKTRVFPRYQKGDTSFFLLGWTPASIDMHQTFFYNVATNPANVASGAPTEKGQGSWNKAGYSNPKVDELLRQISREIDQEKRNKLIYEAMKIHKDEIGHIPLHQQPLSWAVRDGVELVQAADNSFNLRWVKVK